MGNIAKEDVKIRITDLGKLKQRLRMKWNKLDHVVTVVVDSSRSVMHVLYTFLQYFQHAVIKWIQILQIWRPQLRWDKFWEFLYLTTQL